MASPHANATSPAPTTYYLASATEFPPDGFGVLSVEVRRLADGAVLVLDGELDRGTADVVRRAINAAIDSDAATVVLDLRAVSYMDSAGVNMLVEGQDEAERAGVAYRVGALSPQVVRLLQITRKVKTIVLP